MLGKGVRYSTVYQEKGQTGRKKAPHERGHTVPRSHLVKHRLRVFIEEPLPCPLMLRKDKTQCVALNGTERSNLNLTTAGFVLLRAFKLARLRHRVSLNWHREGLRPRQQNVRRNKQLCDTNVHRAPYLSPSNKHTCEHFM